MTSRILVVEDEAIIAADLAERLEGMGYQVVGTVPSGEEALTRAGETTPDLVLMDVFLAGALDGIETADQMWERHQLPVVFLTAHGDPDTMGRARRAESFGYVVKPFEERTLQATIELALYRFQATAQAQRMERWLATTLESIGDGVVAADLQGRITFMNATAEQTTGWQRQDAIGLPVARVLQVVHEGTLRPFGDLARRALDSGSVIHLDQRLGLRRPDGEVVPIADSAAPIRDQEGRITGVVIVFRDAIEQRRAESERLRYEQKLLETQRFKSLGMLAGGIAHDFNNLLTVIRGNIELCLGQAPEDPRRAARLRAADQAAAAAAAMCQQMLAYAGKGRFQLEDCDLNNLVTGTVQLVHGMAKGRADIHLQLSSVLPHLLADVSQLRQVVMNLVLNAVEALPDGRGQVRVRTGVQAIDAARLGRMATGAELTPGDYVTLEVQDTGTGMSPDTMARIFDPFFTTKFTGRGMGLAAVAGIVRGHAGGLWVHSIPGRGSTFLVALPPSPEAPTARVAEPAPGVATWRAGGVALVVDDEELVRQVLATLLAELGFSVECAADGVRASELARSEPQRFRLVVLDLTMPGKDGVTTLADLRQLGAAAPVLLTSGYDHEQCDDALRRDPNVGFLHKPFSRAELEAGIAALLRV